VGRRQQAAARLVHRLFYVVILAMAASGIGTLVLSGAAATLYFGGSAPLPDFTAFPPRGVHGLVAYGLVALIVLHVGAALHHQFIRHDRLLARIGVSL
jgi:cytochrome b561